MPAPITATDLTTRFPEFSDVDEAVILAVLDEVHEQVGPHWPDKLRTRAQLYLAAHLIAVEGGANRSIAGSTVGAMVSRKEGDVEVRFGDAGAAGGARGRSSTTYGQGFLRLQSAAFGGAVFSV